jgi:hypothetical protein
VKRSIKLGVAIYFAVVLGLFNIFAPQNLAYSLSAQSEDVEVEVVVDTSLKFSVDTHAISMRPVVGVNNSFASADVFPEVETNVGTGYTLVLEDKDNDTALRHSVDGENSYISTGVFNSSSTSQNAKWGFSVGETMGTLDSQNWDQTINNSGPNDVGSCLFINSAFCAIELSGQGKKIASSTGPTTSDGYKTRLIFGTQIAPNTVSGAYKDIVTLVATANVP